VDSLSYKTISVNKATAKKEWVVVDATDQSLGRLGTKVAKLLRGKYKPSFTPHVDCGDNVIIINAEKVKLTGSKWNDRIYLTHTGYPGGQREKTPAQLMAKNPEDLYRTVHYIADMCTETVGSQINRSIHLYPPPREKRLVNPISIMPVNPGRFCKSSENPVRIGYIS